MKRRILIKELTIGVILLFIGLAIQPSIATIQPKEIDIEPKDYLFQTIIDIANNPDVKKLFEQNDNGLFKVDIDRNIYRKIFFRYPRLFSSLIFSKQIMSLEYFDEYYNKGIGITNLIGEDKVLEIMESIDIVDTQFFNELNNIIKNDEKLYPKLETLKEMNKKIKPETPYENNPIVCVFLAVLFIVSIPVGFFLSIPANMLLYLFKIPYYLHENYGLFPILAYFHDIAYGICGWLALTPIIISLIMFFLCADWEPPTYVVYN